MATDPDTPYARWAAGLFSGHKPTLYPVGDGDLKRVEVGPGRVLLVGGPPNAGKTALVMQMAFDALRLTPDLRAVACNVEMAPAALLDRQLARLAKVDARTVQRREFTPAVTDKLRAGLETLAPLAERLTFVAPPYTLQQTAATADAFGAKLIVLDYIQRMTATSSPAGPGDRRGQVDEVMGLVRRMADAGAAVVVVAAVGRSRDQKGRNSYGADTLTLASFRESSELEYGADDAYILCPGEPAALKHVKSRYGETRDVLLTFDKPHLTFKPFTE